MISLDRQVQAIRGSVGLSSLDHVRYLRLEGHGSYDAADRVFTRDLYLRDGQLSQGLMLNDDASVFADCYLGSDDEDFFLLVEGPDADALQDYMNRRVADVPDVQVADLSVDHTILGIDGPYAWELVSLLIGPEVIGLPYLTFFHSDGILFYRAGKTGEYGYRLIVPRGRHDEMRGELLELGQRLDIVEVGLDALDLCALENWFLNIRREGGRPVTPIELQQQWRVSYRKSFAGSQALRARRGEGIRQRLTCLTSDDPIEMDDLVRYSDHGIGTVVNAGFSPIRGDWVALALLDLAYAHPGVTPLRLGERDAPGKTVRPPVIANRSLYVNPQVHSYASRAADGFPPIHSA